MFVDFRFGLAPASERRGDCVDGDGGGAAFVHSEPTSAPTYSTRIWTVSPNDWTRPSDLLGTSCGPARRASPLTLAFGPLKRLHLLDADEHCWAFTAPNCFECARTLRETPQVTALTPLIAGHCWTLLETVGKLFLRPHCGPAPEVRPPVMVPRHPYGTTEMPPTE
jgi:hypothetical protein